MSGLSFPLYYIIYYFFSKFDNYSVMTYEQVTNSRMALLSGFLYMSISAFLLYLSSNKIARKYNVSSFLLLGLFLSSTFFVQLNAETI
jgi:hypothetical protein